MITIPICPITTAIVMAITENDCNDLDPDSTITAFDGDCDVF